MNLLELNDIITNNEFRRKILFISKNINYYIRGGEYIE